MRILTSSSRSPRAFLTALAAAGLLTAAAPAFAGPSTGDWSFTLYNADWGSGEGLTVTSSAAYSIVEPDLDNHGFGNVATSYSICNATGYEQTITANFYADASYVDKLEAESWIVPNNQCIYGNLENPGQLMSAKAGINVHTASASNASISGNPYPLSTLTGTYSFSDPYGLTESGSTYQWYTVSSGTLTAISGATSVTYTVPSDELDATLEFCVTPADADGAGTQVCSSTVSVAGIVWYSEASQTGTATAERISNGACVEMSALDLVGATQSVALYAPENFETTLVMYEGSGCTGTSFTRTCGAGDVHNINLSSVGIGTSTLSYEVTW